MVVVDIIICVFLCFLAILFNLLSKRVNKHLYIDIILGIFYASTYLVWRHFSTQYDFLTFFHIYIFVSAYITPFILFYYTYTSKKAIRITEITIAGIGFLIIISRFISWPLAGFRFTDSLPFNMCNIMAIVGFIQLFIKNNKLLKNFILSIGLLGGTITVFLALNEGYTTIWFIQNIDSYILHYSLIVLPIYLFLTNKVVIDLKLFAKSFYFVIFYYFIMYFINLLLDQNFIYTRPGYVDFLTEIYYAFPLIKLGNFEINFIYYIVCLGGTFVLSILTLLAFKKGQTKYNYFHDSLINRQIESNLNTSKI